MVDIIMLQFLLSPNLSWQINDLLSREVKKGTVNIIQFILKSGPVCIIEIPPQKIMCCGFSTKTSKSKSI